MPFFKPLDYCIFLYFPAVLEFIFSFSFQRTVQIFFGIYCVAFCSHNATTAVLNFPRYCGRTSCFHFPNFSIVTLSLLVTCIYLIMSNSIVHLYLIFQVNSQPDLSFITDYIFKILREVSFSCSQRSSPSINVCGVFYAFPHVNTSFNVFLTETFCTYRDSNIWKYYIFGFHNLPFLGFVIYHLYLCILFIRKLIVSPVFRIPHSSSLVCNPYLLHLKQILSGYNQ